MNTIILGDVHGSFNALAHTLMAAGAVDREGKKVDDWRIFQVGDLCNMAPAGQVYRGFISEDLETIGWAADIIDQWITGNHELWFTHGLESGIWYGMGKESEIESDLGPFIRSMVRKGKYVAAIEVDGMLLTHAGLHRDLALKHNVSLTDAAEAAAQLNTMLEATSMRQMDHGLSPITHPEKSIFWNRPSPYGDWAYGQGADYVQVCGHTPLKGHPFFYDHLNAWIIDNGNYMDKEFPTVGALIKRDGDDDYSIFDAKSAGVPS